MEHVHGACRGHAIPVRMALRVSGPMWRVRVELLLHPRVIKVYLHRDYMYYTLYTYCMF